jgi:hypothetical protein
MKWFIVFLGLLVIMNLSAQENASSDFDIDSLFGLPDEGAPDEKTNEDTLPEATILSLVKKRGITFDASYAFSAGMAPGWKETPWYKKEESKNTIFGQKNQVINMSSSFGLDAQIFEAFRVYTSFSFSLPSSYTYFKDGNFFFFTLGNFFFDYNISNRIFFRGGKYEHGWGISPNFSFTNLLSRVPKDVDSGEALTLKIDIPVKIGGIQLLTMTRTAMKGDVPSLRELGYGAKYNIALPVIDLDTGVFYQYGMAFRSFLSLKKTIGKTEVYNEWLAAIDSITNPQKFSGAFNLGFFHDFFDNKLSINGEIFNNTEDDALWYSPRTNLKEEEISPYLKGLNFALNIVYRFEWRGAPRIFAQTRYSVPEESALFIPGFTITPFQNLGFYFAVPMALGNRDGHYYRNTGSSDNRPFSVVLLLSLSGSVKAGYYY